MAEQIFFFSLFPAGGRFSSVDSLFCKYFCPVLPAPVCSHVFLPELMGGLRLAPPLAWAPASSPAGTRTAGMWPPVPAELCVPGSGRHLEIIPARGLAWPDALLPGLDRTGELGSCLPASGACVGRRTVRMEPQCSQGMLGGKQASEVQGLFLELGGL